MCGRAFFTVRTLALILMDGWVSDCVTLCSCYVTVFHYIPAPQLMRGVVGCGGVCTWVVEGTGRMYVVGRERHE